MSVDPLYLPEFALYINRESGNALDPANAFFYRWNGTGWDPPQALGAIGGDIWLDAATNAVQVLVPYTAIGSEDPKASGSLALTVFSTSPDAADGIRESVPAQGATLDHPALVSDMLMPLYPFNTPFSDPITFYDMPALRWRMPYFDSVDGYQVEVARDARFTDIVETWASTEGGLSPYYALIPAAFQSKNAYEDNASYYWRVRIRHERYNTGGSFDYGPWSPAMRFRLDSRLVDHALPPNGSTAAMTPTFTWDRVEGASGYKVQLDNDLNFSSPLFNGNVDGTSFTPTSALPDGTYYWRVAMRRSSTVIGHWTETMSFVKQSVSPAALSPAYDDKTAEQPTFTWAKVLTPTVEPRLAAPRYRLQLASDPNFSSPRAYNTTATSYTPAKSQSLADGTWYWRLAVLDANGSPGTFGPTQRFYKEYRKPTLVAPPQGSSTTGIPTFKWDALDGAAYYQIQIADNALFNNPTPSVDNRQHPLHAHRQAGGDRSTTGACACIDADGNYGRYEESRVIIEDPATPTPTATATRTPTATATMHTDANTHRDGNQHATATRPTTHRHGDQHTAQQHPPPRRPRHTDNNTYRHGDQHSDNNAHRHARTADLSAAHRAGVIGACTAQRQEPGGRNRRQVLARQRAGSTARGSTRSASRCGAPRRGLSRKPVV